MRLNNVAMVVGLATSFALSTFAIGPCLADSEASLSASSSAETMNNSQESKNTTSQAVNHSETNATTHENSQAGTMNSTENNRESGFVARPGVVTNSVGTNSKTTNSKPTPAGAVPPARKAPAGATKSMTNKHAPTIATHSYRWPKGHTYSHRYMARTVNQAARTR